MTFWTTFMFGVVSGFAAGMAFAIGAGVYITNRQK